MPSLGPVSTLKESSGYQPLLLACITLQGDVTPLLLSTHPLDGVSMPSFPGVGILPSGNYLGRLAEQDIEALQSKSKQGIDTPAKVSIHIWDADRYIWSNYVQTLAGVPLYGFRGATLQLALVMWQVGSSNFSTDAPVVFRGVCDMQVPLEGGNVLMVSATTGHNTAVIKLPLFPIQGRCPKVFPTNASQRQSALNDPSSPYYACGYSYDQSNGCGNRATTGGPSGNGTNVTDAYGNQITDANGVYVYCDFLRSDTSLVDKNVGCMARLGNYSGTSVSPDGDLMHDKGGHWTGRFGGVEWSPGTYYAIVKNYTNQSKFAAFSFLNNAVIGSYQTMVYGTQWVTGKIATIIETGNDTRAEVMVCQGDIGFAGIIQVTVNGVLIGQGNTGDPNLWWNFVSDPITGNVGTGGRGGVAVNNISGYSNNSYSALGDPFGGVARIFVDFYNNIFSGFGVPNVQVLTQGPMLTIYGQIATVVANGTTMTVTLTAGSSGSYFINDSNSATVLNISGNSVSSFNGNLNGFISGSSSAGPPGVLVFSSTQSGSGTGGYISVKAGLTDTTNPVWALLDIFLKSNWTLPEISLETFLTCAAFCDVTISYVNNVQDTVYHQRFKCQFSLETRRTAAEVIAAMLMSFRGYLYFDNNGLLCVGIYQTLADQQPSAVTGSNYNIAVSSVHATGASGNGYVAYSFDETNIARVGSGDNERLDVSGLENATVQTPNRIFIQFQDEDNQFVVDSLGEIDANSVTRAGGALNPGGAVNDETLNILGISNMDQATRIANTYIAERQYGNLANDPRGTDIFEIGVTVKVSSLTVGNLVLLSLQSFGYSKQLFRVLKIKPATNFETARLVIMLHQDIWYTDAYGQNPQQFYANAGTNNPARPPLIWQPYAVASNCSSSDVFPQLSNTEWSFFLNEQDTFNADGSQTVSAVVTGYPPVNTSTSICNPPQVPVQAIVSNTGGYLIGPIQVYIEICAVDSTGAYSPASGVISASIPSGVTTGQITISGINWSNGTASWDLFAGTDHYSLTHQLSGSGTPPSIPIDSLPNAIAYAPPDFAASNLYIQAKLILHGGIIGEYVVSAASNTITIGGSLTGLTNNLAGYRILLIGRTTAPSTQLGIVTFTISSYVVNSDKSVTFTVDRNVSGAIIPGDVVVIQTQANISSATTIGDSNFNNAYGPGGVATSDVGSIVRIIAGKGRFQTRIITSVAGGTTYTVDHPWDVIPDSTSWFIVEEFTWRHTSSSAPIATGSYSTINSVLVKFDNSDHHTFLVQTLVEDPTGTLYSSEWRSPLRMIFIQGTQGTSLTAS